MVLGRTAARVTAKLRIYAQPHSHTSKTHARSSHLPPPTHTPVYRTHKHAKTSCHGYGGRGGDSGLWGCFTSSWMRAGCGSCLVREILLAAVAQMQREGNSASMLGWVLHSATPQ